MISKAIFLNGCVTVHKYKNRVNALGSGALNKVQEYQVAECYLMKYEDFIYLCNHLNEGRSFFKSNKVAENGAMQVSLFYCNRADKALLIHSKKNGICDSIAVLYNAGDKVEDRSSSHRARDLQAAQKRRLKELQNKNNVL